MSPYLFEYLVQILGSLGISYFRGCNYMAVILKPLISQNMRMNILIFKEKKRPLMVSMTSIITFYTNYILIFL